MSGHRSDGHAIPIVEEQVAIEKRAVETGRVQVRTVVEEEHLLLRDTLETESVEVERVPIGREVTEVPQVRTEGDLLVVPVVEERLVVEKRLFLVEEIRLRRTSSSTAVEAPVTRRVMRAEIERQGASSHPAGES